MKKKKKKKKNESQNFAKSNAHRKTNAGGSFETQIFFFSLSLNMISQAIFGILTHMFVWVFFFFFFFFYFSLRY